MVDEESKSKGDVTDCGLAVMGSSSDAVNGFANGIENDSVEDGNSARWSGDGFQTYKRRKHTKMGMSETRLLEDGKVSVESASQLTDKQTVKEPSDMVLHNSSCDRVGFRRMRSHAIMNGSDDCPPKHWRNFVLEYMYQSLGQSEGGLQGCIRDALVLHSESSGTTTVKESVDFNDDRHKCPSQTGWILNGSQNAAKGVLSNGSLNESNHHAITKLCQRAFFDIIMSEKFAQLCNLLFENFQGMKVESFFDISLINSRMKEGAYESTPTLFHSDIQQVWTKLQKVGTEIVALAKSLSDKSRTSFCKQVGGLVDSTAEDCKDKFLTQESDVHTKLEQTEACGVYKVCTCRRCGDKADGRDCLVCDSCEEMFHVSCIEPAVVEIPLKNWYCANCTANGIESPHENCVVCEKLNAPRSPINEVGDDVILTNGGTLVELEQSSNVLVEDGFQLLKGGKNLHRCNTCRCEVENGEEFRVCGHSFCPHKYYHVRCLTSKQLKSYGPCWYCPSCLCRACLTDRDDDKIVLCDGCDHAYHIYCMQPPRTSIPRRKWFCRKCYAGIQRIRKTRRAYENVQKKLKKSEEGKGAYVNLENERRSGGVDMLLTAAKTLNNEENLAAIR
uniref:PHD-type domain-containing protein n=1 Tax=Davidia involucrata TaxID=16924 RepID=A0A5B6YGM8_DAVIN